MKKFLRFSFFLFFLFSLFFRYAVLLRYIEYNFCIHLHKRCTPLYNFLSVVFASLRTLFCTVHNIAFAYFGQYVVFCLLFIGDEKTRTVCAKSNPINYLHY